MKFNQTNNNSGRVNNAITEEGSVTQSVQPDGGISIPKGLLTWQCRECLALFGHVVNVFTGERTPPTKCPVCGCAQFDQKPFEEAIGKCKDEATTWKESKGEFHGEGK
jgi:rubrerythrin